MTREERHMEKEHKIIIQGKFYDGEEYSEDISLPEAIDPDNHGEIIKHVRAIYKAWNDSEDEVNKRTIVAIKVQTITHQTIF